MLPVGDRLQIEFTCLAKRGCLHVGGKDLHQHRSVRALRRLGCKLERQRHKPVAKRQRDITPKLRPDRRTTTAQPVAIADIVMDQRRVVKHLDRRRPVQGRRPVDLQKVGGTERHLRPKHFARRSEVMGCRLRQGLAQLRHTLNDEVMDDFRRRRRNGRAVSGVSKNFARWCGEIDHGPQLYSFHAVRMIKRIKSVNASLGEGGSDRRCPATLGQLRLGGFCVGSCPDHADKRDLVHNVSNVVDHVQGDCVGSTV